MKAKAEKVSTPHADEIPEGINWGRVLSWVVVLLPLALWLPRYSLAELFVGQSLFVTLAKIGSLVGTTMMAWSIILSARYKPLDKLFHGLDKMYQLHHMFGAGAFALILWHAL